MIASSLSTKFVIIIIMINFVIILIWFILFGEKYNVNIIFLFWYCQDQKKGRCTYVNENKRVMYMGFINTLNFITKSNYSRKKEKKREKFETKKNYPCYIIFFSIKVVTKKITTRPSSLKFVIYIFRIV